MATPRRPGGRPFGTRWRTSLRWSARRSGQRVWFLADDVRHRVEALPSTGDRIGAQIPAVSAKGLSKVNDLGEERASLSPGADVRRDMA